MIKRKEAQSKRIRSTEESCISYLAVVDPDLGVPSHIGSAIQVSGRSKFPRWGASNSKGGATNPFLGQFLPQTAWTLKNWTKVGGVYLAPSVLDPPMQFSPKRHKIGNNFGRTGSMRKCPDNSNSEKNSSPSEPTSAGRTLSCCMYNECKRLDASTMQRISRRCQEIQTTIAERDRDQSQFRKIKNSTTEQTELNDFKESWARRMSSEWKTAEGTLSVTGDTDW